MEIIFDYFLKFNVSLILAFLFYLIFLQKLTFYKENRVYFISSLLISFIIPFLNIGYFINNNETKIPPVVRGIPTINIKQIYISSYKENLPEIFNYLWVFVILYFIVVLVLIIRMLLQIHLIYRLKRNASLDFINNIPVYKTDIDIAPFSFGKTIFINPTLHANKEINEILVHEMAHVQQLHVIDIMFIEMVAICNWFNPIVWMLKKSIKQNLEYIADAKVVASVEDKKHYQYHLLKHTIQSKFSLTTPFNFLKLKTRIFMMNKKKSPKKSIVRFALVLPVFAILLFSFRTSLPKVLITNNLQNIIPLSSANTLIPKDVPVKVSDKKIEKGINKIPVEGYGIYGGIFDYKTSKPIQGVKVLLKETGEIAITDKDGYFEIITKSLDKVKSRRTIVLTYNNSTKEVWSPSSSYSSTITDNKLGELRTYFLDTEKPEITTRFSGMGELNSKEALEINSIKNALNEAVKRKNEAIEEYDVKKNFPSSQNADTTKN